MRTTIFLLSFFALSNALATSFTVNNTNDSGPGSLREMVLAANNTNGHDTIIFSSSINGDTINVSSPAINISDHITIIGNGEEVTAIASDNDIFEIDFSLTTREVKFEAITFTDFDHAITASGTIAVNLSVIHCSFVNDEINPCTGISVSSSDTITVRKCYFDNLTRGIESFFCGNMLYTDNYAADCNVGAFIFETPSNGILKINRNSFINNGTGFRSGSAIEGTISNNTFFGNLNNGIYISEFTGNSNLIIVNNTLLDNNVGVFLADPILIQNNIFWNNSDLDIKFTQDLVNAENYPPLTNNIGTTISSGNNVPTFDYSSNPLLDLNGPNDNGGMTPTISINANSPAINNGLQYDAPAIDQRGYLRDDNIDIGSFEYNGIDLSTQPQNEKKLVTIYPNPAHESITISNLTKSQHYTVFDSYGNEVLEGKTGTTSTINVKSLISGAYKMCLEDGTIFTFVKR